MESDDPKIGSCKWAVEEKIFSSNWLSFRDEDI